MTLALLTIFIPFLLLALTVARRSSLTAKLPLAAALLSGLALLAAPGTAELRRLWVDPFSLDFSLEGWKLVLLGFVVLFQVMTGVFALSALPRAARPNLLGAALLLAFGSACGVILTDNVLVLLVFWELFLVALYGAIQSGGGAAERVAQKALIIGGASDFLMIFGLMLYLWRGGSAAFAEPLPIVGEVRLISFVLIFLGAGAKAGMFPFHTWIPEAAEVMPATGFAALPASLEKLLGVSFLFTLTQRMFVLDERARAIMLVFALATAFVVLIPALVERNLKRVLALTAISPVGFMIAGMAAGEKAAIAGALFYMLTHATYKSGMFFAAGVFESARGSAELRALHGVGRAVPLAGWGFALAFLAAVSLPPTGGFMAKELIFEGLLREGHGLVLALLALAAILSLAVFCKLLAVILASPQGEREQAPFTQTLPALLLGALAVLSMALYAALSGALGARLGGEQPHWAAEVWRPSLLTVIALAIYALGYGTYFLARRASATAAVTFDGLRGWPGLGQGLEWAAQKRFDAYELGLQLTNGLAWVVFHGFERLIDTVVDGLIAAGQALSRRTLSAAHNGQYANYLGWAIVGFLLVMSLLFW